MTHLEELGSALNDLVIINNDRIEGYHHSIETLDQKDADLKMLFAKMISNSRGNISDLSDLIHEIGVEVEQGTTTSGKIFRTWMSIKTAFSGNDRTSILESCEEGEDAALKAYDMALASDAEMSADIRQLLMDQKSTIQSDHDQIKKLRDLHQSMV